MANDYKNTQAFLKSYGDSVNKEIKVRLRNNGKISSGALNDSIRYEVSETSTKFTISFHMFDYGKYIDKGVQGSESGRAGEGGRSIYAFKNKMPPPEAIENWMRIKGIPKEASYPIRRHIFRFGITPTNFFTIPTTRRKKQLEIGVKAAMIKDAEDIIKKEYSKRR